MGQYLSALRMEVSLLRMGAGGADPALREKALSLQAMVDQVILVMRNLVSDLRPAVLDLGIAPALEWLVEDFRARSGVACHLGVEDASITLDANQTVMVFRIVQESLTNVSRHATASRVDVTLERRGVDCVLMVRDDGRGFDASLRPHRSLGLVGLKERAQMLGGQLDIRSSPGAGAMISVAFPAGDGDSRR
jgi:signal transduction histidine kinase